MLRALRPSAATTLALVAMTFALAGSAGAAVPQEDGTIVACYKKKGGQLRVLSGQRCKRNELQLTFAQRGPKGDMGTTGATGPAGTARAYARVDANGNVDESRSKGVTNANLMHPGAGRFCFTTLGFTPLHVTATVGLNSGHWNIQVQAPNAGLTLAGCPTDSTIVYMTDDVSNEHDGEFYVTFE